MPLPPPPAKGMQPAVLCIHLQEASPYRGLKGDARSECAKGQGAVQTCVQSPSAGSKESVAWRGL